MTRTLVGRHHTEETKRKMSLAALGHTMSPGAKQKLSEFRKGKKASEATKMKISLANRGSKNGNWKGGVAIVICSNCGQPLEAKRYRLKATNQFFCNQQCYGEWKIKNQIMKGRNNPRYGCSALPETRERMSLNHADVGGSNNPNWRGGINPLYQQIRNHPASSVWRDGVFKRDNYTCQDCGSTKSGDFNAHHLYSFTDLINDYNITSMEEALVVGQLWDIKNGITLCKECHQKRHQGDLNGL